MILETDPSEVVDRVMMKGAVPEGLSSYSEMTMKSVRVFAPHVPRPLEPLFPLQLVKSAREQIKKSFLR